MIEISNNELAKVLNLWTGTDEWESGPSDNLYWKSMIQRWGGPSWRTVLPCDQDKEAHALVNFMLKERKNSDCPNDVFYPSCANAPKYYVQWVKDWEERFGDKPQEDQLKDVDHCEASEQPVVDHSISVRYDHLISTEELVKRAQERWPDDGWDIQRGNIHRNTAVYYSSKGQVTGWPDLDCEITARFRTRLLTLIDEARSERTTPEILDELEECRKELCEPSLTKAERFYAFLATPQPDISPGLWGLEREPEAPVRGGDDLGWARENMGAATYSGKAGWTIPDTKGMTRNWRALVTVEV